MLLPRHCTTLSIPLLALPLSCTGGSSNDELDEGSNETGNGDGDPCTEPGSTVPEVEPFVAPAGTPQPTCSTGWASDAAIRDPEWVTMIADDGGNGYYYSINPIVKGLSDHAALLITRQSLQWFDGQGAAGAELEHGFNEA